MKNIILILILIFTNTLISQNLTFEQVLNLQKKDIIGVEEYLSSKDWSLLNADKEAEGSLATVTFAYKKQDISDKAESFIYYIYSEKRKRLNIQMHTKDKYNLFLNTVKASGYKPIANKIEENNIEKVYQNKTNTVIISVSTSKNYSYSTNTIYSFFILSNDDYEINFQEDYE